MAKSNPNGANQYLLDPRQKVCWESYTNPKSETFGNITKSALKAGFTEGYSDEVGQSEWFRAKLWRLNSTFTGEKKMQELMELSLKDPETDKVDIGIARIQADLAKYLTSTQGKHEGYSTRVETDITTKGEKLELNPVTQKIAEEFEQKLKESL